MPQKIKRSKKTKKRNQKGGQNIINGYYNDNGSPSNKTSNHTNTITSDTTKQQELIHNTNTSFTKTPFTKMLNEIVKTMELDDSFWKIKNNFSDNTNKVFFNYNAILTEKDTLNNNKKIYKLTINYNKKKNSLFIELKNTKNTKNIPYTLQSGGWSFWPRKKKYNSHKVRITPNTFNEYVPELRHHIEYPTLNIEADIKDLFDSIIFFIRLDKNKYKCNRNTLEKCYITKSHTYGTKHYYQIYYYDSKKQIYEINIIIDKENKYLHISTGNKGNFRFSKGRRLYKRSIKRK